MSDSSVEAYIKAKNKGKLKRCLWCHDTYKWLYWADIPNPETITDDEWFLEHYPQWKIRVENEQPGN